METTRIGLRLYWGYIGILEKKVETTICRGYIGIMEKKMETTRIRLRSYWGYIGIMDKKMETTIVYWAYTGLYVYVLQ